MSRPITHRRCELTTEAKGNTDEKSTKSSYPVLCRTSARARRVASLQLLSDNRRKRAIIEPKRHTYFLVFFIPFIIFTFCPAPS